MSKIANIFYISQRILVLVLAILVFLFSANVSILQYGDEVVYRKASLEQVRGVPPALSSNPEHPPFAKYLIGLWGFSPLLAGCGTIVAVWLLARRLGLDERLVALSLATDLVFARYSMFATLEVYVALFSVLAVTAYLYRRPWLSGVLWGLAFASKFNALFPFLGLIGYLALRDRRSVLPVLVGLVLAFVATHAVDVANGVFLHHLNSYMWLVLFHSGKNPLMGWTTLFFGAPWYVYYTKFLYNGTEVVTSISRPGEYLVMERRLQISVAPWMGHVAWRTALFEGIYMLLKNGVSLVPLVSMASLLVASSGWFYWYFVVAVPFIHLLTRKIYVALQLLFMLLLILGSLQIYTSSILLS